MSYLCANFSLPSLSLYNFSFHLWKDVALLAFICFLNARLIYDILRNIVLDLFISYIALFGCTVAPYALLT